MYEMYPDTWHVTDDRHTAERPRRRARKEHPVVPAALVETAAAGRLPRHSA